jgi:single-strand DNA-binding protein
MNKVILMGRLTKCPEIRSTADGKTIASYSLAVNRSFKREGDPDADFLNCVAFGKPAEFAEKYFKKGMQILVTGRIQTGSYTNKEGHKVYTTDIIIESQEFTERKQETPQKPTEAPQTTPEKVADGWVNMPENIDDLPFR